MMTENGRMVRGFAIIAQHQQIEQKEAHTFKVKSQSGNGQYVVTNGKEWDCTCPDHAYRKVVCKHIFAVRFWISLKDKIDNADVFQLYREFSEASTCKFCGSINIIKWGYRKNRNVKTPRFKCKDCGQSFVVDEGFARMRFDPKIVSLALDLYFKGISLRKIVDHIKQFYGLDISQMGVFKWLQKYGRIINAYVDQLEPELSRVWNTDEMKIRCGGKWLWLWNVMDNSTRYLLASHVSEGREASDARQVWAKAKEKVGHNPEVVVTDGLRSYVEAFKKEFWTLKNPRTKHMANAGIRARANNNVIERLHGTIRERDKVMRGLKTERTAKTMTETYRTYYNCIRPHQALNGKTPAQQANIKLELGKNKWLGLITASIRKTESHS
ncbi:MAG: IS6 family transposase [Candidatus Bathyarchaeia archaeon]